MTTSELPGAGAWTRPHAYSRITLPAGDLTYAVDEDDEQRIRWGGEAVQRELERQNYLTPSRADGTFDGVFGPKTEYAIKWYQRDHGLKGDGIAGPMTLRLLCWSLIDTEQRTGMVIPANLLYGMLAHESGFDPAAQGVKRTYGTDMGIAQINDESHPEVNPAHAYGDIAFAVSFAAWSMRAARRSDAWPTYAELGMWHCAVASHNNPSKARKWFDVGFAPDEQIALYYWRIVTKGREAPKTQA